MARHSKKLSIGRRQRRLAYAPRKEAREATVSALALIGFRPPLASFVQYGMRPHQSRSRERSPVFGFCGPGRARRCSAAGAAAAR
jgi:hypothetical protein